MHEDFDSHMTVQFLEQIQKDSASLAKLIDPSKNLEDWIDFKIGRARQDLADIRSYIEYQAKMESSSEPMSLADRLASKGYKKAANIIRKKL